LNRCEDWFPLLSSGGPAQLRLCCFAFAGGSASAFGMWSDALPAWVELRALQLPGRASRLREPPISRLDTLIPLLQEAIEPLTDVPLVFFGHSNGALIAYELAHALARDSSVDLRHIVLSSKPAPHFRNRTVCRHKLDDDELIAELHKFGGTPAELLDNREFMVCMLPAIRADFALSETHRFAADRRLDVPAALWRGREDALVDADEIQGWQLYLRQHAATRDFSGGHFYIHQSRAAVAHSMREILHVCRDRS
jgi:medium-chain acyl-[acyl-carrier-protein] hydrolase